MKTDLKIIGTVLLACAVLSDSKETRVGLSLLGVTALFPKETLQILDALKKEFKTITPQPVRIQAKQQPSIPQQGVFRRFGKWSANTANRFWKWIY